VTLPPEIARIVGLRVHAGLWNETTQRGILQLRSKPDRTEREEKRLINLLSYAAAVLWAARRGERAPLRWICQPAGRWSTAKPNLHSISKSFGLRDAVIPADGRVFVRGDWCSAHLIVAAGMSGDLVLQADLEAGDAYTRAMALLAPELGDAGRAVSKILILSALNGAGAALLASTLADFGVVEITPAEALHRTREWFSRYPVLVAYMRSVVSTRAWTTPLGRTVALSEGLPAHKGLGWRWQSFEADALTGALRALRRDRPAWDVALCFYDELLLEVPPDEAEEARVWLQALMDRAIRWAAGLPPGDPASTTKASIRPTWSGVVPPAWPADGAALRTRPLPPSPVLRPRSSS
jgi:hypothetical protein